MQWNAIWWVCLIFAQQMWVKTYKLKLAPSYWTYSLCLIRVKIMIRVHEYNIVHTTTLHASTLLSTYQPTTYPNVYRVKKNYGHHHITINTYHQSNSLAYVCSYLAANLPLTTQTELLNHLRLVMSGNDHNQTAHYVCSTN